MQRLVLFDIDNTLISIRCNNLPQRKAMNAAFEEAHGIRHAFEDIVFTGGMDLPLLVDIYRKFGLLAGDSDALPDITSFKRAYFNHLDANLKAWMHGLICPGVPDLLQSLSSDPRVQLGLETGNFREAADIKLRRYGLDGYFRDGAFGGDHMEKNDVVASAITRCQASSGRTYCKEDVLVVGDTPSDVEAGNANGVGTLAVCTGFYSADELKEASPSFVIPDLSNTHDVLNVILRDCK